MMPSGQVATLRCHLGQILNDLRNHFSGELKMPADVLLLLFDGEYINLMKYTSSYEVHIFIYLMEKHFGKNWLFENVV